MEKPSVILTCDFKHEVLIKRAIFFCIWKALKQDNEILEMSFTILFFSKKISFQIEAIIIDASNFIL